MPTVAEIITTTLRNRSTAIADAVRTGSPFYAFLSKNDRVEYEGGGSEIIRAVEYANNATVAAYSGTDIIDTTIQTVLDSSRWDWSFVAGTHAITDTDLLQNSGPEQKINLMKAREKSLIKSFIQQLETFLFAAQRAAGSKAPNPLSELIDVDPTGNPAFGNVGKISTASSANTWWRNRTVPLHVDTARAVGDGYSFADTGVLYMRTMFEKCSQASGVDAPKILVCTQELYSAYESKFPAHLQIKNISGGDLGGDGFSFKGAPIMYSNSLTGGTGTTLNAMYFINTDYLTLILHRDENMKVYPTQRPTNQKLFTTQVGWAGQLVCTNRIRQGVIEGFQT